MHSTKLIGGFEKRHSLKSSTNLFVNLNVDKSQEWFVWTFHPAVPGSSPKHTIYAFIVWSQICASLVFALWNERK